MAYSAASNCWQFIPVYGITLQLQTVPAAQAAVNTCNCNCIRSLPAVIPANCATSLQQFAAVSKTGSAQLW
jgi:hypothetical protein